jgi:hypothetical protein
VKRLGEVSCRACGAVAPAAAVERPAPSETSGPDAARAALAQDVAAALDRVLRPEA